MPRVVTAGKHARPARQAASLHPLRRRAPYCAHRGVRLSLPRGRRRPLAAGRTPRRRSSCGRGGCGAGTSAVRPARASTPEPARDLGRVMTRRPRQPAAGTACRRDVSGRGAGRRATSTIDDRLPGARLAGEGPALRGLRAGPDPGRLGAAYASGMDRRRGRGRPLAPGCGTAESGPSRLTPWDPSGRAATGQPRAAPARLLAPARVGADPGRAQWLGSDRRRVRQRATPARVRRRGPAGPGLPSLLRAFVHLPARAPRCGRALSGRHGLTTSAKCAGHHGTGSL